MTDQPDNAQPLAPDSSTSDSVHNSAEATGTGSELSDAQSDPLQILMQTSAAAHALQKQFDELKVRRSEVIAEREQLAADRSAFETRARRFAEQVASDRTAQREITAELDQQKQQLSRQADELQSVQESLDEQRADLERKREQLHEVVNAELARERSLLQRHQQTIDEERVRLADRMEDLERQHAERMQQVDELLQTEREQMRDAVRKEIADELNQLQRERQEWNIKKERESNELREQSEDLQQQRELFGDQLETEHQRLRDEIEKRRQTLLSEQNNLQRRYRFQFEHLARAREDFEEELRELRREQQLFRRERASFEEQHQLRFSQLRRIRDVLMERDSSLARERKVIERFRVSSELDLKRQQDRLAEEQDSVRQDMEVRNRRLRQAEQASAETARRIEQRLQHVNRMRAELDAKQRDVLEQRLVLEELQASAENSDQENRPGYQQARRAVETFFSQLARPLQTERERLQQQAADLTERRAQFRRDRSDLEKWFAQQEQNLASAAAGVSAPDESARIVELENQLAALQASTAREQHESEVTIRQLLDEIARAGIESFQSSREPDANDGQDDRLKAA